MSERRTSCISFYFVPALSIVETGRSDFHKMTETIMKITACSKLTIKTLKEGVKYVQS